MARIRTVLLLAALAGVLLPGCAPRSKLAEARQQQAQLAAKLEQYKQNVRGLPRTMQRREELFQEYDFLLRERARLQRKLGLPVEEVPDADA